MNKQYLIYALSIFFATVGYADGGPAQLKGKQIVLEYQFHQLKKVEDLSPLIEEAVSVLTGYHRKELKERIISAGHLGTVWYVLLTTGQNDSATRLMLLCNGPAQITRFVFSGYVEGEVSTIQGIQKAIANERFIVDHSGTRSEYEICKPLI